MANPAIKDGHLRIANSLWLEWMRIGPLKERVYKAIIWECWGFADRRKLKEPVEISRGTISKLTGINDKSTISKITAALVNENLVIKVSDGRLDTCKYWPNQDYETWVTSGENTPRGELYPRGESTTTPRGDFATTPRGDFATHTYIQKERQTEVQEGEAAMPSSSIENKLKNDSDNEESPHLKSPLIVAYRNSWLGGGNVPKKDQRKTVAAYCDLRGSPNYADADAIAILELLVRESRFNNKPFFYIAPAIREHLENGTKPGENRDARKRDDKPKVDIKRAVWDY